jgi:hypothetical protein
LIGALLNWYDENRIIGEAFYAFTLSSFIGIILLVGILRISIPIKVGIHNNGIIIILRKKEIEYTWEELDMKSMTYNESTDLIEQKRLGRNYYVKKNITRAIIDKWQEIRPTSRSEQVGENR